MALTEKRILELLQRIDAGETITVDQRAAMKKVTVLNFWSAPITMLPESIGQLTGLKKLDLSNSDVTTLPESIGKLTALEYLDLNNTPITALPKSIGLLPNLKTLDLRNTRIDSLPESIVQLNGLECLDLSGTQIKALPASIGSLTGLEKLSLSNTSITSLPQSVGKLTDLRELNLNHTRVTKLPETIGQLTRLKELYLWGSQITALPETIGQLSGLKTLFLSETEITVLPEYIWHLTALETMNLSYTRITTLPESIGQLTGLETLELAATQITTLPDSIGQLSRLETLNLSDTQITTLPDSIGQLSRLETLNLTGTQITTLPDSIGQLSELKMMDLSDTQITALSGSIGKLTRLEMLDLSYTKINALPESIGQLSGLKKLDLSGLALSRIPESLALRGLRFVEKQVFWIVETWNKPSVNLYGVTLTEQDKSIFLEHPELIPTLYQKEEDILPVRECRVIFLGDGAVGKSYTIKRFRAKGRKESAESPYLTFETPGIEILDYEAGGGDDAFTIHFWDFGGQQLLHSMHRCFLTEDCCYVITVKTRETKTNARARYWLRNVQAFAPNSPILLYVNCWENDDGRRSIDEPGLRREFPMIRQVVYCSAKQAEDTEFRERVMEPIVGMAAASEGVSKQVPRQWVRVREAIEQESKRDNYLTRERYHTLCAGNGIEDEKTPDLLSYFNNLGVCFSYHRDRERNELADYKLLNPAWLTNAIYAVIEEGRVHATEGRIGRDEIQDMLCNRAPELVRGKAYRRTVPELVYKPEECPFILDVAILHELCYPVDENTLFFPALCGTDTPAEALSEPEGFGQHVSYQLRYQYLPDSVLHRLMIRCMKNHLSVGKCWLHGMILYVWNLHRVFVRMADDESLRIDVYSTGEQPAYALFWMLRKQIVEINEQLNLIAKDFILDGDDAFPFGAVFAASQMNASLFKPDGSKRYARELLGEFYDPSFAQSIQVKDGMIQIPLREFHPREFHPCKKDDQKLRSALYEAYNRICPYCNGPIDSLREMQVDYIFPTKYKEIPSLKTYADLLSSCGFDLEAPDYIENYFPTHGHCNRDKSNRVNEFLLPYWHDLAAMRTPKVLRLMKQFEPWNVK